MNVDYEVVRNAFRNYIADVKRNAFPDYIKDVTRSAFRDYIVDGTKITDHSEFRAYAEAGTKE